MLRRLVPTTVEEFYTVLQQELTKQPRLFVLFTGAKNPSTGLSWCPDCVRAEPLIDQVFEGSRENTTLITFFVDREPYRSSDYVFRKDPQISLRCVPTLIRWADKQRLNDVQCQSLSAIQELIEE